MGQVAAAAIGIGAWLSATPAAGTGVDVDDPCAAYAAILSSNPKGDSVSFGSAGVVQTTDPSDCRRQVAAGAERALVDSLREPTDNGAGEAIMLTCVLRVPGRAAAVGPWIMTPSQAVPDFVRAVCLANLAEWPEGRAIFARATRQALRETGGRMEIDPAFTAAARRSSAVHPAALEVLAAAARRKARDYDKLLAALCQSTEPRGPDVETLCREGPREEKWDEDRSRGRSLRRVGGGVLAYAGVVAGAYATRNTDAGRAIPTVGGVLSGTILGLVPTVLVEFLTFSTSPKNDDHSAIWVLGALVGGTAGGYLAWRLSDGPNARTAVTAATFILPCVIVARLPF